MIEVGPKHPRIRDDRYLAFLRQQSCCVCGAPAPSDAAHIRIGLFAAGMKPHDKHAVPLCRPILGVRQGCHKSQHSMNEQEWWDNHGINPFDIAKRLYAEGGHPDAPQPKRKPRKTIAPRGFPKVQRKMQSRGFGK